MVDIMSTLCIIGEKVMGKKMGEGCPFPKKINGCVWMMCERKSTVYGMFKDQRKINKRR